MPRGYRCAVRDASDALDVLRADPCGARLLRAFAPGDGVHLVGGAVRDLLLGRPWRELDVVVEGDVDAAAARLGGEVAAHERFGTARVTVGDCAFDLVRARAESYAHPGALPDVRPGTLDDDLHRRDVTVNAMALRLDGTLAAVEGARRGPRGRRAARAARRVVRRRPHARLAGGALRGPPGLRRRATTRARWPPPPTRRR